MAISEPVTLEFMTIRPAFEFRSSRSAAFVRLMAMNKFRSNPRYQPAVVVLVRSLASSLPIGQPILAIPALFTNISSSLRFSTITCASDSLVRSATIPWHFNSAAQSWIRLVVEVIVTWAPLSTKILRLHSQYYQMRLLHLPAQCYQWEST